MPIANTNSTVASDWQVAWSRGTGDDNEFQWANPVASPDIMLLQKDSQQVMATNRSGLFKIHFKKHSKVGKTRNLNKLGVTGLLYPLSKFSLRVASVGDSSSVGDFSVQPVSAVLTVNSSDEYTNVEATLPLTADSIDIRWLNVEESNVQEEDVEQESGNPPESEVKGKVKADTPQASAVHDVVHSVGEGIVRSKHILKLSTPSSEMSSLNSVQFDVCGEGARVTSVEGHALQHWESMDSSTAPASKLVRAIFKSSHLDSTASVIVYTESDRPASSAATPRKVELPRIECRNVLRQVGHVAVIKDSSVEVHEHSAKGHTRCEPTEISSQLRSNIDRPIVLSYKYLNPQQSSVVVSVKDHVAMETLEAAIDRVHYKAVVTDTHTMHSLILTLQSTKLQYLEVLGLPTTASMFTLMVNSVPAKPVEGQGKSNDNNKILVPLLIGLDPEAANEGNSMRTSVEVTYVSTHDSLGQNGTLPLAPPSFALPVSVLTSHLRLPLSYEYTFSGDFGTPRTDQLAYPIPAAFTYKTGKRVVEEDYEFSAIDDIWAEEDKQETARSVKIVTPNTGRSFYFHRLFVVDSVLSLNATYNKHLVAAKRESWWTRLFG